MSNHVVCTNVSNTKPVRIIRTAVIPGAYAPLLRWYIPAGTQAFSKRLYNVYNCV